MQEAPRSWRREPLIISVLSFREAKITIVEATGVDKFFDALDQSRRRMLCSARCWALESSDWSIISSEESIVNVEGRYLTSVICANVYTDTP